VRHVLAHSDVFILPSRSEGLPRAMIEAMAMGLVCVGSRVGGMTELLDDDLLVPAGDPGALAAALCRLLSAPQRLLPIGLDNLERARGHRREVLEARRSELYARLRAAAAPSAECRMAMTLAGTADAGIAPTPSRRNVVWALARRRLRRLPMGDAGGARQRRPGDGRLQRPAAVAPLFVLANLQLRSTQATDAAGEYAFADYLRLRVCTTVAALLVLAAIVAFAGYGRETAIVILLVGIAKAFESMSDVLHGALQQRERMDGIAGSLMLKGLLGLVGLAIGVAHRRGRAGRDRGRRPSRDVGLRRPARPPPAAASRTAMRAASTHVAHAWRGYRCRSRSS
jgi:hypothetical protein